MFQYHRPSLKDDQQIHHIDFGKGLLPTSTTQKKRRELKLVWRHLLQKTSAKMKTRHANSNAADANADDDDDDAGRYVTASDAISL